LIQWDCGDGLRTTIGKKNVGKAATDGDYRGKVE